MKPVHDIEARKRALNAKERRRRAAHGQIIESTVAMWNRFAVETGSFADHHSTLSPTPHPSIPHRGD